MATADWILIEERLRAVAERGDAAWPELQAALHAELERLARFQPIGRLRRDVDAPPEIAARVLTRLHANDYRAVKRLFAAEKPPEVRAWVRVLVRTAAIDVMREHADYVRGSERREAGWISLHTLASQAGAPAPNSLAEKQREVERFLAQAVAEAQQAVAEHGDDAVSSLAIGWKVEPLQARRVIKKGGQYLPILRLVLAGHSYPEVATQLAITRREVELIVGYIEELLQARRFAA